MQTKDKEDTTLKIKVDAWAPGSLAFVQDLEKKFEIQYLGVGEYAVTGNAEEITSMTSSNPEIVKSISEKA